MTVFVALKLCVSAWKHACASMCCQPVLTSNAYACNDSPHYMHKGSSGDARESVHHGQSINVNIATPSNLVLNSAPHLDRPSNTSLDDLAPLGQASLAEPILSVSPLVPSTGMST